MLNVEDVEPLLPFYCDLLGFRVSDYGLKPPLLDSILIPYHRDHRGLRAMISLRF